jgi:hypothetical protein
MSETKFTPGPWEKKFNYLRVQAVAEPKVAICYTDTFGTSGQGVGNANLIAAAPEMFEALENLVELFSDESPAFIQAQDAIAKAKGGAA